MRNAKDEVTSFYDERRPANMGHERQSVKVSHTAKLI